MTRRVLVLGNSATGRGISAALAADSAIECVMGVRRSDAKPAFAKRVGVGFITVDADSTTSVRNALRDVFAVVNAGGPFRSHDYRIARQCAQGSVHYVDTAASRKYVAGITALNKQAQARACLVVAGATLAPAISGALVDSLLDEFDRVTEIHTAISPMDEQRPWFATLQNMMRYVGRPMRIKHRGLWRDTFRWSEPETVRFPAPVGRQRTYLCDVVDLDLFPGRYDAQTVTFRASVSQAVLNYALAGLGRLRRLHNIVEYESTMRRDEVQRLLDMTTGIRVRVHGERNGADIMRAACLIARTNGNAAIACSPAIALIRKWVREGIADVGAMPCLGLLNLDALKAELLHHDVVLIRS